MRAISKQFLLRTNWKILHLTEFFTQPAVVMVVTNIRYAHNSGFGLILWHRSRVTVVHGVVHVHGVKIGQARKPQSHASLKL